MKKDRDIVHMLENGLVSQETMQRLIHDLILKVSEQQEIIENFTHIQQTLDQNESLKKSLWEMPKERRLF